MQDVAPCQGAHCGQETLQRVQAEHFSAEPKWTAAARVRDTRDESVHYQGRRGLRLRPAESRFPFPLKAFRGRSRKIALNLFDFAK